MPVLQLLNMEECESKRLKDGAPYVISLTSVSERVLSVLARQLDIHANLAQFFPLWSQSFCRSANQA